MFAAIYGEEKRVIYVKVKESVYKPAQAQGLQEVEAPRSSRQLAHESDKVVSLTHQPPLPPRRYPWYSFLFEAESTPESQCSWRGQVNEEFQ